MYEFALVLGVILFAGMGTYYLRTGTASMFHPQTYYMFIHGLLFVLRPVLAYVYDFKGLYRAYEFTPSLSTKVTVLLGADLGFVVFSIACLHFGRARMAFHPSSTSPGSWYMYKRAFLLICLITAPIAIYSLYSGLNASTDSMSMDLSTGVRINVAGNGYFSDARLMLGPICAVVVWLFRYRFLAWIPFILFVFAKAGSGGRWPFVMACITLCLFYLYDRRRMLPTIHVIIASAALLALFTFVGADRGQAIRDLIAGNQIHMQAADAFQERPLESMDYGNMEFFEYLVEMIPQRTGTYDYFLDNLQLLTEPIPRVLWRGKPIGAPIQMYNLFDYGFPIGMTYSMPGEGWAQLGWLGIVIWCGLWGLFYGKVYTSFVNSRQTMVQVAIYMTFLPITIVVIRDGTLLTIFKSSAFTLLPVLLWPLAILVTAAPQRSRSRSRRYRRAVP